MSHWTVCKVRIKNPDPQLLRSALEVLAQKLGSKVVDNYEVIGYHGRAKCDLAIPLKLPYGNGYGIIVKNGEIKVVVDDHGAPLTAEAFAQELTQTYTALAVAQAVQQLGWNVTNVQEEKEGVLMEVEVYA